MQTRTTIKLKKELTEAREQIDYEKRNKEAYLKELREEKAKRETLEKVRRDEQFSRRDYVQDIEDQNQWMRNLIEALTIDPKIVYAKTDRDIRRSKENRKMQEQEIRRREKGLPPVDSMAMALEERYCKHGNPKYLCDRVGCPPYQNI